ncbi:jg2578, partial [Pararge aegeria aegeria]
LISLLNVNTTSYGREDIYSILYQISNLNLRFFRWDVNSMKMLFNVIIKEKKHTLGSLKHGLRELFNKWRLDFSNSTTLLRQARIFRPPCVVVATDGGSTKSPKVTKYPKKTKPTTPCEDYDDCKY